jgi:hypothetical protein
MENLSFERKIGMPEITLLKKTLKVLLDTGDREQSLKFFRLSFHVPEGIRSIIVRIGYNSVNQTQLPLMLFDPLGNVRLIKLSEGTIGPFEGNFRLGPEKSDPGTIPGPIPPGDWRFLLYKRRFSEDLNCTLEICAVLQEKHKAGNSEYPVSLEQTTFDLAVYNHNPAWYNGELHVHSNESTGRTGVDEIYQAASKAHFDFLALTDHFSAAHWLRIEELKKSGPPLFLKSMEVASDFGHANIHGLKNWINPFVDDNLELASFLSLDKPPSMESIADEAHRMGGLLCINHPQSGMVSWRYHNFPWEKADLIEIWCLSDGPGTVLYPVMWDGLLCRGYHITAVGSSDSHHPTEEGPWKLGQIRNWVYAKELSREAIIEGLKKGALYIAYGPSRLMFQALYDNKVYQMGSSVCLATDKECTFIIEIESSVSGNLFIFTDALIYDIVHFDSGEPVKKYQFTVDVKDVKNKTTGESYFRIEFHEELVKPRYYGMVHRDHASMRLLSNPIWIKRQQGD